MEISFPVSDAVAAELKEKISAGQQRAKEFATASTVTSTTPLLTHSLSDADVEATMIKLVGSFIHNTSASAGPTLKDITSFVTTHVSGTEYGRVALTDALWFWGTQTQSSAAASQAVGNGDWSRLCSLVRELGSSRILDVTQMKKTLELNLLVDSGLWADKPGLDKRLVKINTSLVYRQQKYNLLREESEGYSKLLTVLAALPSPPSDPASHITNVFALIGYFDLDPNRVLDMVLEVMEHQLWNASFLVLLKKFRRSSIAHILGFKFVHYHEDSNNSSEGQKSPRESSSESDTAPTLPACATPKSLFLLAATLLTADLLDLDTLLPYLAPNLEDTGKLMVKERNRLKSEIKSFGVVNLSAKASTQSNKEKEKSDNTAVATASGDFAGRNQIIGVVAALILVKNWPLANEMMQLLQGVAIVDVVDFPDVAAAIISLVSWSINEVYKPVGFLSLSLAAPSPLKDDSKNSLPLVPLLTRSNAEDDCGDMDVDDEKEVEAIKRTVNKQFEAVSSLDFIVAELKPMLISLGHHLSDCPDLYSRICRVLKVRMESLRAAHAAVADASEINEASLLADPELQDILLIISETLLPALTKLECNPALAALLWGMLSLLPFQVRFDIYRVWKGDGFGKQAIDNKPLLVCYAEARALHGAKGALKRLSKDNTKQMGRQLAKYTHSCALGLFHHILSQIEVYDNMIPFVVDALKYTTDLAKDVMAFTLLCQLDKSSEKLKPGETHYSGWFSALAKFIGSFYRKYPNTELYGMLHFLLQRLSTGDSLDLLILKEFLHKMGGCETFLEVSHTQLQGLSGGRTLQLEIMRTQGKDAVNKRAVRVLRDSLLNSKTALPMLLFIAQIRSNIIFGGIDSKELKLLAYLYDICQDVLMQFTDFLVGTVQMPGSGSSGGSGSSNTESILELMPPMKTLLGEIGLAAPVAFQLVRPLVRLALQYGMDIQSKASSKAGSTQYIVTPEVLDSIPANIRQWHPYSPEMKELIQSHLPTEVWSGISVELYLTFWSLSLYDIMVPSTQYDEEIRRLNNSKIIVEKASNSGLNVAPDRATARQTRQEITRITSLISALTAEHDAHRRHVERMHKMLLAQKGSYLSHVSKEELPNVTSYLMQYCVHDRVLMSPVDAQFCSQFFLFLHRQDTPFFSTIHFIDKTVKTLAPLIFCSTEYEAGFIGFFINDLFSTCNKWVNSKSLYMKEAHSKCGFDTIYAQEQTEGRASYEQFVKIYKIWHTRLRTIAVSCLKSPEYMHVRSALRFLTKVAQEYPTRSTAGKAILSCVENVEKGKATADMEGLKVMAKGVGALLKVRSRTWIDDESNGSGNNSGRDKKGDSKDRKGSSIKNSSSSASLTRDTSSSSISSIGGGRGDSSGRGSSRSRSDNLKGERTKEAFATQQANSSDASSTSKKDEKKQKEQDKRDKRDQERKDKKEQKELEKKNVKEQKTDDKHDEKESGEIIEDPVGVAAGRKRGREDDDAALGASKKSASSSIERGNNEPAGKPPRVENNAGTFRKGGGGGGRGGPGKGGKGGGGRGSGNRDDNRGGGKGGDRRDDKGGDKGVKGAEEQPLKRPRGDSFGGNGGSGGNSGNYTSNSSGTNGGGGNYQSGGSGGNYHSGGGGGKGGGNRYNDNQRGHGGGGDNYRGAGDNFRGGNTNSGGGGAGNYAGKGGVASGNSNNNQNSNSNKRQPRR